MFAQIDIAQVQALSEIERLQQDVSALPYDISDYKENIFDCSNMAVLSWEFLNAKWNATILRGIRKNNFNKSIVHSWVEVGEYCIEVTKKEVIFGDENKDYYDKKYPRQYRYNSSEELWQYFKTLGWENARINRECGYRNYLNQYYVKKYGYRNYLIQCYIKELLYSHAFFNLNSKPIMSHSNLCGFFFFSN